MMNIKRLSRNEMNTHMRICINNLSHRIAVFYRLIYFNFWFDWYSGRFTRVCLSRLSCRLQEASKDLCEFDVFIWLFRMVLSNMHYGQNTWPERMCEFVFQRLIYKCVNIFISCQCAIECVKWTRPILTVFFSVPLCVCISPIECGVIQPA